MNNNSTLRVAVADDEPKIRAYYRSTLAELGHQVVCAAENGRQLIEQCRASRPDLVIADIKMPDIDGIQAVTELYREMPVPVILVSAHHDREFIERASQNPVLAYLIKPISQADLETTIALVTRRFREFQALHQQADTLRQVLEDRKTVERAKGVLMKRAGLDEDEAFRRIHMLARDRGEKMVEVARMILTAEEAMTPKARTHHQEARA
jgi:response regulator NasT